MTDARALSMKCGACGESNEIDLPSVQEAARSEAEKLTDAEVAKRYRAAFELMVGAALPESLRRLPVARIRALSDAVVLEAGRDVLTVMLSPVD